MNYSVFEELCRKVGTTPTALAVKLGLSKGNTSSWKKGGNPSVDILIKLSDELNCTTDMLLGKEKSSPTDKLSADEREVITDYRKLDSYGINTVKSVINAEKERCISQANTKAQGSTSIRIFSFPSAAGTSIQFSDDDMYTYENFSFSDVPSNADFGIRISGDSMEPKFPNGGIAWVKRASELKHGDLGIFILNSCPYFKIYDKKGLKSINPNYALIEVYPDDNIQIVGKVIGYYNDGILY